MISDDLSLPLALVSCDVCHHDIPIAEAVTAEMTDYVVYFCGLDCYDRWRLQREAIHSPVAAIECEIDHEHRGYRWHRSHVRQLDGRRGNLK